LNKGIEDNQTMSQSQKDLASFGVGIFNGTLGFILAKIYEVIVDYLVIWENHA
jgi:homoserine dehydrogenase